MEALGKSMKWIIRLLAVGAVLTVCAVAAVSQTPECTDDFKTATYTKWYENKSDHQDVAYQAATEYLNVCPNEPADNPYVKVLKKFIETSNQHTPFLLRKAQRIEEYLDQH